MNTKQMSDKAREDRLNGKFTELIIKGYLVEKGMEDPMNVTVIVDSIGPKWITGYVKELGITTKFHVTDDIEAKLVQE